MRCLKVKKIKWLHAEKGKKMVSCAKILIICVFVHNRKSIYVLNTLNVLLHWHLSNMGIFRKIHYTELLEIKVVTSFFLLEIHCFTTNLSLCCLVSPSYTL